MNEEYILQLSMMQQQAEKLNEQIEIVNSQIQDLEELKASLSKLEKGEILANLGKGIFIKTEIKEKELYVNVGEKVIVKKNAKDTQELIVKQVIKLENAKTQILDEIQAINHQLQYLIENSKE